MTTETSRGQPVVVVTPDLSELADRLVAAARTSGVEPTGPGGLLTGLTKQVLEAALEVELTEHLGHERHERSAGGNVRNGTTPKTVRTDVGEVRIDVPLPGGHVHPGGGAEACTAPRRVRRRRAQPVRE